MPERYHPSSVLQAYREQHPAQFDGISNSALLDAIQELDPDTYALVDPLLIGAEVLDEPSAPRLTTPRLLRTGQPYDPGKGAYPLPTPPRMPSTTERVGMAATRMVPAIGGGIAGFAAGGPVGMYAGGAAGSAAGEAAVQQYEKLTGLPDPRTGEARESLSPGVIAFEGALGAVNPAARGATRVARVAGQAGYGALLGGGGSVGRSLIETGDLPSPEDFGLNALVGTVLGGTFQAGAEKLTTVFRGRVGTAPPDLPTAIQAKTYLQEIGEARVGMETVEQLRANMTRAMEMGPPPPPPPAPRLLTEGTGGPPSVPTHPPIRVYPSDAPANIELVGTSAPPASRIIGARDVGAVAPTPRFTQVLEESLQAEPGPPRLVRRPLTLTAPEAPVAQTPPTDGPPLLSTVQYPLGRTQQLGEYMPPLGEARGRLPGVDQPRPLDNRPYATGPNAGPRRPPEQELHGVQRKTVRYVKTPTGRQREVVESPLRAEDPGTYPPEVRRELATMVWELEGFPHERWGSILRGQGDSERIAEIRKAGLGLWGAGGGAPVYHDILTAAQGSFAHTSRGQQLATIRAALLDGKGNGLTDAAAQVARSRLMERQVAGGGRLQRTTHIIAERGDEGDALIGWIDDSGARALPEQARSPFQQMAHEAEDGEITAAYRIYQESGGRAGVSNPEAFDAMLTEGVRRGLLEPEQLTLVMDGDGQRPDVSGGPPPHPSGMRPQTDPILTLPPGPPGRSAGVRDTLRDLWEDESGILQFNIPAGGGGRARLKSWLRQHEATHGDETWFHRASQAVEDGDWDRAWKTVQAAAYKSAATAYAQATTPQAEAAIRAALRGTPLQDDFATSIVAAGRAGQQMRPAPRVKDVPASARVGRGGTDITVGPAGILNLGPPARPAPIRSRAKTLDKAVMDNIMEVMDDHPDLIHLVRGNRDAALKLNVQIADVVAQGLVRVKPEDFPGLTQAEIGRHIRQSASNAGQILNRLAQYTKQHNEELYAFADRQDMGGALARALPGREAPPSMRGTRGRPMTADAERTMLSIMSDLRIPEASRVALLNDLTPKPTMSLPQAALNSQYAVLTSGLPTAIRNAIMFGHRYGFELLDDLATIPFGHALEQAGFRGEADVSRLASAHLQERLGHIPRDVAITPRRAIQETLQDIYQLQAGAMEGLSPNSVRRSLRLFQEFPAQAAHLLGTMEGEQLKLGESKSEIFNWLMKPNVRRAFQIANRSQELPARALVADTELRALLRVRGLNPAEVLSNPDLAVVAPKVGGERELESLLFKAGAAAREMTYSGGFAQNSIPGWVVHMVNEFAPAKLVQRFPGFNFARAPRFIYDHGPWSMLDLIRLPFDRKGWTSTGKYLGGGRLYRGLKAQALERDIIPELQGRISTLDTSIGDAVQELQATSREWRVRNRQVASLQKKAQQGLPDIQTRLESATQARDQLAARRTALDNRMKGDLRTSQDLEAKIAQHWDTIRNAQQIKAPTYAAWLGKMATGTLGMLGAAIVIRSQEGAEGTRYYQYRFGREGDQDAWTADTRALAPIPQFLFVADVLVDFWRHTDWDAVQAQMKEDFSLPTLAAATAAGATLGSPAGPGGALSGAVLGASAEQSLKWNRAVWDHYQGKYTPALLSNEFASAFFSISRAAGATLTINDFLTRNEWPSLDDAAQAIVGTFGQWLSGFAVPGGQFKDLAGTFSEEERKVRSLPPVSPMRDPVSLSYPLAQPLTRLPGLNRLLPEVVSQTTGEPMQTAHPGLRVVTGISGTYPDFITEEARRVGLPGSALHLRTFGDTGFDRLAAETYAKALRELLADPIDPITGQSQVDPYTGEPVNGVLSDPYYLSLGTPALQRDHLMKWVFPAAKRTALAEVRELLGDPPERPGEARRRRLRWDRYLATLETETPTLPVEVEEEPDTSTLTVPPPPPFF